MRLILRVASVAMSLALPVAFAFADPSTVAPENAERTMSTPPVMLGQVALGLFFVVAIILGLAWVLKKLGHGNTGHNRSMRVLAALPLGTREKAVLVQVGDQQMMLGVAPGRVNCLHVFDEPVVTPPEKPSDGSQLSGDFASRFKEALSQKIGRS